MTNGQTLKWKRAGEETYESGDYRIEKCGRWQTFFQGEEIHRSMGLDGRGIHTGSYRTLKSAKAACERHATRG